MAFLGQTYHTDDLPEGKSFDPLPAGWYQAHITEATLNTTKDGSGQYIKVRYDITGPTHEGRVVYGNVNIRNANPKAEEIGRQNLGDIARAIGIKAVSDTDQLIGGRLSIKLSIQTSEGYDPKNEVKAYKAIESGGVPSKPAFAAKPAPAASNKAQPPWKRAAAPVADDEIPF